MPITVLVPILCCLFFTIQEISCQETASISLKTALIMTLEESPDAIQEDLNVQSNREEKVRSWRAFTPRLDAQISQTHYEKVSGSLYSTPSRAGSLSLQQPLWDGSAYYQLQASYARERSSSLLRDSSRYLRAITLIQSALDCETLTALEGVLYEQKKQLLHDIDIYQQRTGMGLEERSTLLGLKSRLGKLQREIAHNEVQYQETLQHLHSLTGAEGNGDYYCVDVDAQALKETVISFCRKRKEGKTALQKGGVHTEHTRIMAEKKELQARQLERKKGAMQRLPTISAVASKEVRDPQIDTVPSWSVACQVVFPIFTQGNSRSAYHQALIAEKWQVAQLKKVKQAIFFEKQSASHHLFYTEAALESARSVLEFSVEKMRIEKERVERGVASHRSYLDALVELHKAQVELATSDREYIGALLRYIDAEGVAKEFVTELIAKWD